MELFSITCTTCRARLKVRDVAAIGQILGCPKCGSMVQVAAPEGWQPPSAEAESSASGPLSGSSGSGEVSGSGRWREEVHPSAERKPAEAAMAAAGGQAKVEPAARNRPAWRDSVDQSSPADAAVASPAWIKWTLFGGLPAMALVAVASLLIWSSKRHVKEPQPVAAVAPIESAQPKQPQPPAPEVREPARRALDRRWIPEETKGILSLRLQRWNEQPTSQAVLFHLGAVWNQAVGPLFTQFDLSPEQVARLTWMKSDLTPVSSDSWLAAGVVVLELDRESNQNRPALDQGEALDWKLGGAPVYRSMSPDWQHPFAIVDEFTIVTGPEEILRELADRTGSELHNAELGRLLDLLNWDQLATGAVDLAAMRQAGVMPDWLPLVEVWHVPRDDWQVVREMPRALGVQFELTESLNVRLGLACATETEAEQVREALDRSLAAMEKTMASEVDGLTKKLLSGQITTADASRFKRLLLAGGEALKARQSGIEANVAWAETPWRGDLPALAVSALAAIPELEASRLAAARPLDEQNQLQFLQGLIGYEKAEGALPFGAAEASLLPPETRLSWIATLLPYYDHLDWHGELNFARSWNDAANNRVTRRPLELAINPALGPSATPAGFPVTHYVGLAGVGPDAALLEPRDPRAGAFGYRRQVSLAEMGDGAGNTIALMGVSGKLGAWGSGGEATVRPLTEQPYINGPDGFGSGQPDGMLVGMADGSVRFLSKEIDPSVLEALATINGGEKPPPIADGARLIAKSAPEADEEMPNEPDPDEQAKPAEAMPRRERDVAIDVNARLNDALPAIEFANTPLADVVELLSQLSTAPIHFDLEALAEAGVSPRQKISFRLTNTTVGEALSAALKDLKLIYVVVDDQVLITSAGRREQKLERFSYDVAELLGGDTRQNNLASWVERFVEPVAWQPAGGSGSVKLEGKRLVIQQTRQVAEQVTAFLDKLRTARGKPPADGAALPSLASRFASAKELLATPVTANFREPAPLAEIADHLRSSTNAQFAFDGLALSTVGISDRSEARLVVAAQPLADALRTLLEPLGLSFRVGEQKTIVITTAEAARQRLEVEFYAVASLLKEGQTPEMLLERIKSELSPRSWKDAGGPGDIEFDAASSCIIVLQTQALQIELELLFDDWKPKQAAEK